MANDHYQKLSLGPDAKCRCLFFGEAINGEVWTDGRSVVRIPFYDPAVRVADEPPTHVQIKSEDYIFERNFFECVSRGVPIYVSTRAPLAPGGLTHRERSLIEVCAIDQICRQLPADFRSNRFWLARGLWLAGIAFEEAMERHLPRRYRARRAIG